MKLLGAFALFCALLAVVAARQAPSSSSSSASNYKIGTGIWDITGPAAEIGMMGYAMLQQKTGGIHLRQRARAFIFDDNNKRIVFVSTDTAMIFWGVKQQVVALLQAEFGNIYQYDNVMLSGTHTHSGPAGYSYNPLYDITSLGFHKDSFDAIVTGIVQAIKMAHNNLSEGGRILVNNGTLVDANINRSPTAYLNNPEEERARYPYDTDKNMTLLRFEDQNGKELGLLNWFSVHGTSMNNTNSLISGDNKGYACYYVEKLKNGQSALPGLGPFVASFAQTNEGDVSPNTRGPSCPDGTPCDSPTSTCGGKTEGCTAKGPGKDMFESTKIIGTKQALTAMDLYSSATTPLSGPIDYRHAFVDFTQVTVSPEFSSTGKTEHTCVAALGDSFAAGTTDGPGMFDFRQGTNSTSINPFWNFIAHFLSEPSAEQKACHAPKPILINAGGVQFPAPWTASVIPLQFFRIGQLFIIGIPAEFTTMSGRRMRNTVRDALYKSGLGDENSVVVIAGLSNEYTHYVTTYEEYQHQRYEGASTMYGPHTLAAYQQEFVTLVQAMAQGKPAPTAPPPADISSKTFTLQPGVVLDVAPGGKFGAMASDVQSSYKVGDTVSAVFYGANPRNNLMTQRSFCNVERLQADGSWVLALTDGDWETRFYWQRKGLAESLCTCQWDIAPGTPAGTYRITHSGYYKILIGTSPYSGSSSTFTVSA